jgi:hypothetical protein
MAKKSKRRTSRSANKRRSQPGAQNPAAKLTPAKVRTMRAMHKRGAPLSQIATKFRVGKSTAFRVVSRGAKGGWAHVR